ncbi:hypothetical protein ACFROC_24150 [Nocardia tengchongensis]|uniref:hypothetical protein n=1 Tax=Nocardia tengchongensis TaxID=2055889 RepID=UPI003680AD44
MGLCVGTDGLAFAVEGGSDPEYLDSLNDQLRTLNELLASEGLPLHRESTVRGAAVTRDRMSGVPYSFLHYLRRAYARACEYPDRPLAPVAEGESAADDPAIEAVGSSFTSHLICHSDCEGYYVPVDFREVLFSDELDGALVGSSTALLRELVYVAPYLGIRLVDGRLSDAEVERIYAGLDHAADGPHPFFRELEIWIMLFEAARISIENGTIIEFG